MSFSLLQEPLNPKAPLKKGLPTILKSCCAELIGTFYLVTAIALSAGQGIDAAPFAIGGIEPQGS